jgi:hypothetical protein
VHLRIDTGRRRQSSGDHPAAAASVAISLLWLEPTPPQIEREHLAAVLCHPGTVTAFKAPFYERPSGWASADLPPPTNGLAVQSMATVLEELDGDAAEAA